MLKRALISVSDKTDIIPLARALHELGVEILSTGGTLSVLRSQGVEAVSVSDITSYPEFLDGRMKTLHPSIHAAIMAKRDSKDHMEQLENLHITPIDLVVINLYPFKDTLLKGNMSMSKAIENIDIGGPALIRAGALNYRDVIVLVDPSDYGPILDELKISHAVSIKNRYMLAYKAFSHTSQYDTLIQAYFKSKIGDDAFPDMLTLTYEKVQDMRYGENPHQKAAFFREIGPVVGCISDAHQIQGEELSFNSINDADSSINLLKEFDEPTAVLVKHGNTCGIGSGDDLAEALTKVYPEDIVLEAGGVLAVNREIDEKTAGLLSEVLPEAVIAPSFKPEALEVMACMQNLSLLALENMSKKVPDGSLDYKKVGGGLLIQYADNSLYTDLDILFVTREKPGDNELLDLCFAMKTAKHARTNAIVIASDRKLLGVGQGQSNREDSAEIAIYKAEGKASGAVLASDGFLRGPGIVESAAKAGIKAIIQPGGDINDEEVISACNKYGIAMVFTGIRHFKH